MRLSFSPLYILFIWACFGSHLAAQHAPGGAAHPRLYLNHERIAAIQKGTKDFPAYKRLFDQLLADADRLTGAGPPPYHVDPTDPEQLWQREVGNALPVMAMAYTLTHHKKYLDGVVRWSRQAVAYPVWGEKGDDLSAGHLMFGLAVAYDWCFEVTSPDFKRTLQTALLKRGGILFNAALGQKTWSRAYLQNHLWINLDGLTAAAIALKENAPQPQVEAWLDLSLKDFRRTTQLLGPDGASHEGPGYWSYGTEFLLKFMDLARDHTATNLYDTEWWQHTADYRIYLSLPQNVWNQRTAGRRPSVVDLADADRFNWYGPDYILRKLAHEYANRSAQYLAAKLDEADVNRPGNSWLNLLWYDPSIREEPLRALPTIKSFDDLGLVSTRSDWTGSESLLIFKCGPMMGHGVVAQKSDFNHSAAHVHPDANSFSLFGCGRFLIRNAGYLDLKKSAYENTLRVNGLGQLGEGGKWFDGNAALSANPTLQVVQTSSELDYLVGDATSAYDPTCGLRNYTRHILFLKQQNVLIVVDRISVSRRQHLTLDFHPEISAVQERDGPDWISEDRTARLLIQPLGPTARVIVETLAVVAHSGKTESLPTLKFEYDSTESWNNAVSFSWSPRATHPVKVSGSYQPDTSAWTFIAGNRRLDLNLREAKVTLSPL